KTTYSLLVSLILALTCRTAQAGDNNSAVREGRLSLDEVTGTVLANNPAIKAAQEKWQAMKARVPQAAAWEDLRAQARSRVARYVSIPANAFTDQSFMLQQEVPISGENLSRARAPTAEAGAAKLLEAQSDIFRRISDAQSQLNVLMNRPAQSPLAQPSQIPFQSPHFSLQALQAVALSARPEMQRAQNRVEAERFRIEL